MSINGITCEIVDEGDLDTRYLAGKLSPEGAEAFEAHFFGCERCWELVQQGLAVRSAFDADLPARSPTIPARPARATRPWWGLAAAAAVAVVALGVWQIAPQREPRLSEDVFRGESPAFLIAATADSARLRAAWPRLANADLYQIRLYTADGTLVAQRERVDTSIVLQRDSLPLLRQAPAFWEVQALDHLRQPVARSDLTPAVTSNRP